MVRCCWGFPKKNSFSLSDSIANWGDSKTTQGWAYLLAAVEERELGSHSPTAVLFHDQQAQIPVVLCGVASGKHFMGPRWVYARIIDNPETLGLIGMQTHDQIKPVHIKAILWISRWDRDALCHKWMPPKEWGWQENSRNMRTSWMFP